MQVLDAVAVSEWAGACVRSLSVLRPAINGINVYPVADSDTGSNLLYTMTGAHEVLAGAEPADAATALAALARGAVRHARGNSGVILSQVVRGMAEWAANGGDLDGVGLAAALGQADRVATGAVSRPVAGTMLTVLHAASASVRGETRSLAEVARTVAAVAAYALEETPKQLPALAEAGVVDAGGRGLVAVLDALAAVITGETERPEHELEAVGTPEPQPYAWEVMYLLEDVDEDRLPALRKELSGFGDSVTVAGDGSGSHAVHVHCADIGAAIEAGLQLGRPRHIRVEPLVTPTPIEPGGGLDRSVVAVVRGGALAELLRAEGLAVLAVADGETPGVTDLIGLFNEAAGQHLIVLPGGLDLTGAADTAAGHPMAADRDVVVIPCASPVQVLAALAVHDAGRRVHDDVVAMAEAAAATRRGELRIAREDSLTWVGRAQTGDVLGLVDDEVVLIEPAPASETNLVAAAMGVLNRMLALGGELVTVLGGADAPPGVAAELAGQLRLDHPEVELTSYASGQRDAVLLMGVE
ncbi:DAK2 domain-containing protein [Amycolatopsis jiangsuensis]|uniref:DAK2 domain fusion protein YloV n=1 Tax=Amycolatopsis jiangsuensis TaxID=1181879 RepID=A0A840IVB3_9PSEU|nr:DAK2 domain-containing protein [Amycolatopsis jiangsuensis]MBB4685459.1 DAK2 domain fusion protein YloV [Amycolatopsis jiangsuensis]